MNVIKTGISDVLVIEPKVFNDERGFFYESFNHREFEKVINRHVVFVQDNHSKSSKGVLRGLHYQLPPYEQGKLVRCVAGEVFDVVVDIRKNSPTIGQWIGVHLTAENKRQIWIPEGFAHGFLATTDNADVIYKTTNYYSKAGERSIIWNDEQLAIKWPLDDVLLSEKDQYATLFNNADLFEL
ncbi:dTDP-4-dehydrorhamnose 3,5-epimerase [Aeromonas veronii]